MTVVSAMKFNQYEGAIVADEQSSGSNRKYDIAEKIHIFSNGNHPTIVMGGTGAADVLEDGVLRITDTLSEHNGNLRTRRDAARIISHIMAEVKRKYVDGYLYNQFGLREVEFQSGHKIMPDGARVPIEPSLMQRYHAIISGEGKFGRMIDNEFLTLIQNKSGIQIYRNTMSFANPIPIARPYDTVGSGADMADGEIYSFFERIPRDERAKLNPMDGIAALLNATERASVRNIGVGGTPLIAILKGEKDNIEVISPPEANSRLAGEIVKGTKAGFLPESFQREALTALMVEDPSQFATVEPLMQDEAGDNWKKLDALLRGYK